MRCDDGRRRHVVVATLLPLPSAQRQKTTPCGTAVHGAGALCLRTRRESSGGSPAAGARRSRARRSRARRSRVRRSRARRSGTRRSRARRSGTRRSRARRSGTRRSRARRSRARRSRARRSRARRSPWSRARCSSVSRAAGARRVRLWIEQPASPLPECHRAWAACRCCPHPSQSMDGSIQGVGPAATPRIIPTGRNFDAPSPVQQNGPR